jgi:hypothetical protein
MGEQPPLLYSEYRDNELRVNGFGSGKRMSQLRVMDFEVPDEKHRV